METVIKAAVIAVTGSVLALMIKKSAPETALLLTAAAAILIAARLGKALEAITDFVLELAEKGSIDAISVSVVLKTLGIAITSRISSDICRDAGQNAAASAVELCGAVISLYIAIPLMESVLNAVEELL